MAEEANSTEQAYTLPKIDFSTFVLSINSSALVQLGLIDDPGGGPKTKKSSHGQADHRPFGIARRKNQRKPDRRRREYLEKYSL
jgi:hypothetical protein